MFWNEPNLYGASFFKEGINPVQQQLMFQPWMNVPRFVPFNYLPPTFYNFQQPWLQPMAQVPWMHQHVAQVPFVHQHMAQVPWIPPMAQTPFLPHTHIPQYNIPQMAIPPVLDVPRNLPFLNYRPLGNIC